MPDPEKNETQVIIKEPVNVMEEFKNKEGKTEKLFLGLSASSLDFLKWIFGTLILGIAGVCSTYILKSYELKIQSRNTENVYIRDYLSNYLIMAEKDSNHKYERSQEMFEILALSTTDCEVRARWIDVSAYMANKKDSVSRSTIQFTDSTQNSNDSIIYLQSKSDSVKTEIMETNKKDTVAIKRLELYQKVLLSRIDSTEKALMKTALAKLNSDKYANQVLINPPTVLAPATPSYELIYDLERYAAVGYFNQITDDIQVTVLDETEDNVKIRINHGKSEDIFLAIGQSKVIGGGANDLYRISIRLISYNDRKGMFKIKKVATYHIRVERKTSN